jgi:very-short-patch-repair endonuclease
MDRTTSAVTARMLAERRPLRSIGWHVLRFDEADVIDDPNGIVERITVSARRRVGVPQL